MERAVHDERPFGDERRAGVIIRAAESQRAFACLREFHRSVQRTVAAENKIFRRVNRDFTRRERTGEVDGGVVGAGDQKSVV